ncbi:MAG: replication-associated recombination protein A [Nitrospiraceae bacterium]|nr:replication-associated recombination protein A [Nitrospiraceae bacterium]
MQPEDFGDFLGQDQLLGEKRPLRRLIEEDRIVSLILYGPPGTGKTALARIIAAKTRSEFKAINAVTAGIKDIREAVQSRRSDKTILFIDEIHRFNKLQQDALLPHIESGELTLIGASTENPFFSLVPALASRSMIFRFNPLSKDDIKKLLLRAVTDRRGLGAYRVTLGEDAVDFIASMSEGDARRALNILELSFLASAGHEGEPTAVTLDTIRESVQSRSIYYDEDDHYNTISAFIKSMRGSDPDAAIYWLAKMIAAGEDPLFIARRIVICAAEDVGNADPQALVVAVAGLHALERIGMPEGKIPLAQAVIYVATAPKSNASYLAVEKALESVANDPVQAVPDHLKDAHYPGARRLGVGKGYLYPHDYEGHYVEQDYLSVHKSFYTPSPEGYERTIQSRLHKRRSTSDA